MKADVVDIEGYQFWATALAIKFGTDEQDEAGAVWLPLVAIEVDGDIVNNRGFVTVTLPEQLALEKGLV